MAGVACLQCLEAPADARLDGFPLCLVCVGRVLAGERLRDLRQCVRCHGPMRGGHRDAVPVCFECVSAELERAQAAELNRELAQMLPPLDERWRPRELRPPELTQVQQREQLDAIRKGFRERGVIEPPPPPKRDWLDD